MEEVILAYCSCCVMKLGIFLLLGAEFNGDFNLYLGEVKVTYLWVFCQCHHGLSS